MERTTRTPFGPGVRLPKEATGPEIDNSGFTPGEKALSNEFDESIPESWYEKTESKLVCLRCHKAFNKEYKSKQFHRRKKARGANMFSIWAWHNFKKHLFKCWGWHGNGEEKDL